MGTLAFILDIVVETLTHFRWWLTEASFKVNPLLALAILLIISIVFVIIASCLTVLIAPSAIGSGIPEAMGMLNGVHFPDFISMKALAVKLFGLGFAVSGGLCAGKEGPLVHMGSIVGIMTAYIPCKNFSFLRNDFEKRKLMAAGIAAGVSAAFGAPIGGSLFAFEMSKPSSFWTFSLTWKVFFASSISTFMLSLLKQVKHQIESGHFEPI